ncbi:hypothetical protein P3X46_022560 [Hevea brasiliensis]|uniref:RNA polymerase II subunit B1 CTD phosphatase RPAP2 homolog n=1 Tax=Hevea brasiliensis TaxID=3981 RepID=A0ABQ9L866_HEVBR|nr:putative RNA polymerase II subunit B1 CTD phosphatase RPAP2 homolog isoform X2 [Hevea brasiliensis]KAJ9162816.1 hypothetical protein P3X46_022560 [Hevea brasiliensis]
MEKDQSITVKDTVYRLQLSLLEGIKNEDQLFAAGSLMSLSDYEDVVIERSIANLCGYPLCKNFLPLDRSHKGRYRISLKEHKVYDQHETYMYCSSSCVVNSRAFAGSLQKERCSVLNPMKLNEILKMFDSLGLDSEDLGENGDLGLSKLKIQEKMETNVGEVPLEEWIGPSNSIEGYVPQRDHDSIHSPSKNNRKEGSKAKCTKPVNKQDCFFDDMNFMSTIITEDEYSISKAPSGSTSTAFTTKLQEQRGKEFHKGLKFQSSSPGKHDFNKTSRNSKGVGRKKVTKDELNGQGLSTSNSSQISSNASNAEVEGKSKTKKSANLSESMLKPSLKSFGAKKSNCTVTWADEKVDAGSRDLCEFREMGDTKAVLGIPDSMDGGHDGNMLRFESAEACAIAISQAAEAIASGDADVTDAMSEAGVIILPHPHDIESVGMLEQESASLKWPTRPGIPHSDLFDPEDSWYDAPPEGFSLSLSPFATMWMALFAWVTSSSLAYVYGRDDESSHEDYLSVNGREYPRKVVLRDGRSSEIKLTVEGCLARALPGLVADLRLPIPISTLEQGVGRLLDTMSFYDAIPAFRMKQWQVIAFLLVEALSVCRIPALTSYMTNRRMMLHQLLDGAQINAEEYEVMKDLMIPLGRDPRARSGA